ncbi:MAG: aminoacetone oxidase family FAD-binding enzyme, partial [Phycisphaerales bacterium]|nr:aminoacetone oxidase family FAD-binding enzyme [Phycisphaerales bacterium]
MATAIFTARRDPSLSVLILDGAKKLGAKILVSGGGRCNVTNRAVTADDYWGGSRNSIRRVLNALPVSETIAFFEQIGAPLVEEPEFGKLFPVANRARAVLDALLNEAERLGVQIALRQRVAAIEPTQDRFRVKTETAAFECGHVVLATGGLSFPKTGSDGAGYGFARAMGHSITPTTPALVPLILEDAYHEALSGVAHPVVL